MRWQRGSLPLDKLPYGPRVRSRCGSLLGVIGSCFGQRVGFQLSTREREEPVAASRWLFFLPRKTVNS